MKIFRCLDGMYFQLVVNDYEKFERLIAFNVKRMTRASVSCLAETH
jgi:hypothetical protein